MIHTKKLATMVIREFKEIGIETKLIGSVEEKGTSENDIDLVLLDYPTIDSKLVSKIKSHFLGIKYTITDWGGFLMETLNYNLDLFPNSFMKKCYYCKKKCCIYEGPEYEKDRK